MSTGAVNGLTFVRTLELSGRDRNQHRLVNRIRECLIEEASLNYTERFEIVFDQDVEILRMRGFQFGIPNAHRNIGVCIGIDIYEWSNVSKVGPGDADSVG